MSLRVLFCAPLQMQSWYNFLYRVWKGFYMIRDSAEIERVIWEYRKNPAVNRDFCIGFDAGFSLSVVHDS